jgi:hypothetical protein
LAHEYVVIYTLGKAETEFVVGDNAMLEELAKL